MDMLKFIHLKFKYYTSSHERVSIPKSIIEMSEELVIFSADTKGNPTYISFIDTHLLYTNKDKGLSFVANPLKPLNDRDYSYNEFIALINMMDWINI